MECLYTVLSKYTGDYYNKMIWAACCMPLCQWVHITSQSSLQDCKKANHQSRSEWKATFKVHFSKILNAVEWTCNTKALPGLTIFVACWRVHTSDNISLFEAFSLLARSGAMLAFWWAYLVAVWLPYCLYVRWFLEMTVMLKALPVYQL